MQTTSPTERKSSQPVATPGWQNSPRTLMRLAEHLLKVRNKPVVVLPTGWDDDEEPPTAESAIAVAQAYAGVCRPEGAGHVVFLYQQQGVWFSWVFVVDEGGHPTQVYYLNPQHIQPPPDQWCIWQEAWPALATLPLTVIQTLAAPIPEMPAAQSAAWLVTILQLTIQLKHIPLPSITITIDPAREQAKYASLLQQDIPLVPLSSIPAQVAKDLREYCRLTQPSMIPEAKEASVSGNRKKQKDPGKKRDRTSKALKTCLLARAKKSFEIAEVADEGLHYPEALQAWQISLAVREIILGREHPDVAPILNNIANVYQAQSHCTQALETFQRALAITKKTLGSKHPDVATKLNNIANVYQEQSHYTLALETFRLALAIRKKTLGSEHTDVAATLHGIANVYQKQSHYTQALETFQRALAIYKNTLGPEHTNVADTLHGIANVYQAQSHYTQALETFQRALAIYEKKLGPEHPKVAATLNGIASAYQKQSHYILALKTFQGALAIYEKKLGPKHLKVAATLHNMANIVNVYQEQSHYTLALKTFQHALAIYEKKLGPEHPTVAATLNGIASAYQAQSEYAEALPYRERAYKIYASSNLGPFSPETCAAQRLLANTHQSLALLATIDTERLTHLQEAKRLLSDLHKKHLTYFTATTETINSPYDLQDYDLMLKQLARVERLLGNHLDVHHLYLQEAERWQSRFPFLAGRYLSKAERELSFLADSGLKAEYYRQQSKLLALQGRWPRALTALSRIPQEALIPEDKLAHAQLQAAWDQEQAQWVDEDLVSQWQACLDSWDEIQNLLFKDLTRGDTLSGKVKNRLTELLIKLRNMLDQGQARFIKTCFLEPNRLPASENYFPFSPSKSLFKQEMEKKSLLQTPFLEEHFLRTALDFKRLEETQGGCTLNDLINGLIAAGWLVKAHGAKQGILTPSFDPTQCLPGNLALRFSHLQPALGEILAAKKIGDSLSTQELATIHFPFMPELNPILEALVAAEYLVRQLNSRLFLTDPHKVLKLPLELQPFEQQIRVGLGNAIKRKRTWHYLDSPSHPATRKAVEILSRHQAWHYYDPAQQTLAHETPYWQNSWLDILFPIANDSKHVRLTPQGRKEDLQKKHGLLRHREMSVQIDYVEPQGIIYPWSFTPLLEGITSAQEQTQLSRTIYYKLREKELLTQKQYMLCNPKKTRAFITLLKARRPDARAELRSVYLEFKQTVETALSELTPQLSQSNIHHITKLLLRRAMQHEHLAFKPDRQLDVERLIQQSFHGVQEIITTLGDARIAFRTPAETKAEAKTIDESPRSTLIPGTLGELRHRYDTLETKASQALQAGDVTQAAQAYAEAATTFPAFLRPLCHDRQIWLAGGESSQTAQTVRVSGLSERAQHFASQGLFRLSHQARQKAKTSQMQERTQQMAEESKSASAYTAWQSKTDEDLRAQLEHVRESGKRLPERIWHASRSGSPIESRQEVENRIAEMLIKVHHLLDQSITRWINRKLRLPLGKPLEQHHIPCRGTTLSLARWAASPKGGLLDATVPKDKKEESKKKTLTPEQRKKQDATHWGTLQETYKASAVWRILVDIQSFETTPTTPRFRWLAILRDLSNASKHARLPRLHWSALHDDLPEVDFEKQCQLSYFQTRLSESSFVPPLQPEQSSELYQQLIAKHWLEGAEGFESITEETTLALAKGIANGVSAEQQDALRQRLTHKITHKLPDALPKPPKGKTVDPALINKIADILLAQAHVDLGHDPSRFFTPQTVSVFTLLNAALEGTERLMEAIFNDLPEEEDLLSETALGDLLSELSLEVQYGIRLDGTSAAEAVPEAKRMISDPPALPALDVASLGETKLLASPKEALTENTQPLISRVSTAFSVSLFKPTKKPSAAITRTSRPEEKIKTDVKLLRKKLDRLSPASFEEHGVYCEQLREYEKPGRVFTEADVSSLRAIGARLESFPDSASPIEVEEDEEATVWPS